MTGYVRADNTGSLREVPPDATAEAWKRVGRLAQQRRRELGLTQRAVAGLGGPSTAMQRNLELGLYASEMRGYMRTAYERALSWADGSIDQVLAGLDPTAKSDLAAAERIAQPAAADTAAVDECWRLVTEWIESPFPASHLMFRVAGVLAEVRGARPSTFPKLPTYVRTTGDPLFCPEESE